VVEAFYEGYHSLQCRDWEFLVKLDADLSFKPDLFQRALARFQAQPNLLVHDDPLRRAQALRHHAVQCETQAGLLVAGGGDDDVDGIRRWHGCCDIQWRCGSGSGSVRGR
jgi:hypothetical protein